jgi:hypothetical protein
MKFDESEASELIERLQGFHRYAGDTDNVNQETIDW